MCAQALASVCTRVIWARALGLQAILMDHDVQDVGTTGLDALRFLCSNFETGVCRTKSNIFSKLYSEMQTRETSSNFTSPPPPSILCSPRKQRKAYIPARVLPLEEEPLLHEKSALTDDPSSLIKTMSNCAPTTHHDSSLISKKKSDISGKPSLVIDECHANDSSMTKTTKGKRNKRQSSQCGAAVVCKNLACKALLHAGAPFCRRCSCCICKEFDDNKDPSLWITCDAEEQDGCGLSCHVECALQDRVAGVVRKSGLVSLDGSFFCRSCGKVSSLLSLWKKQLLIAKNARRVDVFCHRLLLSHRILKGTLKYEDAHSLIDTAVKKLEVEVGLMTKCFAKLERCIVNRLSCNLEVQNMIDSALEKVESLCEARSLIVDAKNAETYEKAAFDAVTCEKALCTIQFEDVCSSSIVVVAVDNSPCDDRFGYKLWHRKATDPSYPAAPTYSIQGTSKKVLVSNLQPQTLYAFKMVPFSTRCDGEEYEAECCTEGVESTAVENHVGDDISDSMNGETKNVEGPQQHSSAIFQCMHKGRTEQLHGGAMEDLNNVNLPSMPEVHEDKDKSPMEELGDVIAIANEEHKSSGRDFCPSTDLDPRVTDSQEDLKNRKEEVVALKNTLENTPTKAANVETTDDSNVASQSLVMQLLSDGTRGRNLAAVGNGKDDSSCDHSKVDLHNFEFAIKVVRWLEHQGHLDKEFRTKFLTWYSLRATDHEKRVVSIFIDTLQDSAASLAAQLVDAFQDAIDSKRQKVTKIGYYRRRNR